MRRLCISLLAVMITWPASGYSNSIQDEIRHLMEVTEQRVRGERISQEDMELGNQAIKAIDEVEVKLEPTQKFDIAKYMDDAKENFGVDIPAMIGKDYNEIANYNKKGTDNTLDELDSGVFVFVSQSMGDKMLKEVVEDAMQHDAYVLIRGVEPDQAIDEVMLKIRNLLQLTRNGKMPRVRMDPYAFKNAQITQVPSIIIRDDKGESRFSGRVNIKWSKDQIRTFGHRDYGINGKLYAISEADLVDEIQRRLAQVDLKQHAKGAAKRYFENKYQFINLPSATQDQSYLIDPSFETVRDQTLPGNIPWTKAGQRYNPLQSVTLRKYYFVLDPLNESHIEKLDELIATGEFDDMPRTILMLRIPSEDFHMLVYNIKKKYQAEAYLYTERVHSAFHVENVPAVVSQYSDQLLVREFGVRL